MRHRKEVGHEEYAIHEVYFDADGQVQRYTRDALSPREASIAALRATLISFLEQDGEEVLIGDLGYAYSNEDIEWWLEHIDDAPLDYEQEDEAIV